MLGGIERGLDAEAFRHVFKKHERKAAPLARQVLHPHVSRAQLICDSDHGEPSNAADPGDELLHDLRI